LGNNKNSASNSAIFLCFFRLPLSYLCSSR